MVFALVIIRHGEKKQQTNSMEFWDINRSPNPGQKTEPRDYREKREILTSCELSVTVDHTVKIRENEKRNEYLDLARELN